MKKEKFDIQGMTCSSCQSHVQKAVEKLDGIKSVNVNLLSNNMMVEYDEKYVDNNKIIKAVQNAGYGATNDNKQTEKQNDNSKVQIQNIKKRLIISVFFLIPLMYIAMGHMHESKNMLVYAFTQFLILIPIVYINRNYFINGFKRLLKRAPSMDSLIAIGSSASIVYGIYAMYRMMLGYNHENIYFESAGTILTLITFGKYLEAKSKGKTNDAISKLISLAPKKAIIEREGKEIEIETEKIMIDDIVVIKPGASIPIDGIIIDGHTFVDQSSITGEGIPVERKINDNVISGTVNKNGHIKVRAIKVGENTTLSQIIKLVEEASNSKAPIAKLADRVSGIFVPIVMIIAIITFIIWLLVGKDFEFALTMAISVLVISCPCALGLATPVAIMVGTGKGAENGILIKSAESLETLHLVDTVIFDKTGTITEGKPKVTDIKTNIEENDFLKIAGSLEKKSEHPIAIAITEEIKEKNIEQQEISEFEVVPGRGIKGKISGILYICGNNLFMQENGVNIIDEKELLEQGKTVIYFAKEKKYIGMIAVADTLKKGSYDAIDMLKKQCIDVIMITGDNGVVANNIGKNVGIHNIISEVLPQDKEKEVEKLQKQGKKVAYVGDGINDSPALVKADVGIAIGSGTDIAIESADVVLIRNDLNDVNTAINLSKKTIKTIKENLFWAFFYNIIGIPIAAGVFYNWFGIKLNPMIGALAMSFSSVCVVTNALRLKKFKKSIKSEKNKESRGGEKNMKTILIDGMQCNHCKMSVKKALSSIDGVTNVEVSLENKNAIVKSDKEISDDILRKVIVEAGFEVKEIKRG